MTTEAVAPVHPDDELGDIIKQELSQARQKFHALKIVKAYETLTVESGTPRYQGKRRVTRSVADVVYPANSGVPRGRKLDEEIEAQALRIQALEAARAEFDAQLDSYTQYHWKEKADPVLNALDELEEKFQADQESTE